MLTTLGAPERRRWRSRARAGGGGRRGRARAHHARDDRPAGAVRIARRGRRLAFELRAGGPEAELEAAFGILNRALHAWRAGAADPYAWDVALERALVARIGLGAGESVADGRFADAWELPPPGAAHAPLDGGARGALRRAAGRSRLAPRRRGAACSAPAPTWTPGACARRRCRRGWRSRHCSRSSTPPASEDLERERPPVAEAANLALRGDLTREAGSELAACVERMESALRRMRLGGWKRFLRLTESSPPLQGGALNSRGMDPDRHHTPWPPRSPTTRTA